MTSGIATLKSHPYNASADATAAPVGLDGGLTARVGRREVQQGLGECGGARLKPAPGHCCVFCSYGTVACPPVQEDRGCR